MVEAEMERYSDIYSDYSLEAQGARTMVYRYTFRNHVDPEQAESNMASLEGTLKTAANDIILPEMRSAGIEDPALKWVYQNPDGTIVTVVYNSGGQAAQTTVGVGGTNLQFQVPARGWATVNWP